MPTVNCRKLAVPPVVEKLAKPFSPSRIAVGLLIPLAGKQSAQVSCPLRIAGGLQEAFVGKIFARISSCSRMADSFYLGVIPWNIQGDGRNSS